MSDSYDLIHLSTVNSTSHYLKQYLELQSIERPLICVADEQTAGYGQQGKRWITNENSAIFSIAWPLNNKMLLSPLFSLKLAMLLHETLCSLIEAPLFLKWPNDLYDAKGKVAGLLIEQQVRSPLRCLIIGIGINRGSPLVVSDEYSVSGVSPFSTKVLLEALISKLNQTDFSSPMAEADFVYWSKHDLFRTGESVSWVSGTSKKQGVYQGINLQGQAELRLGNQRVQLTSGVHSIRKLQT